MNIKNEIDKEIVLALDNEINRAISTACDEMIGMINKDDCGAMCPFGYTDDCLEGRCNSKLLKDKFEVWFRKKYGFEKRF